MRRLLLHALASSLALAALAGAARGQVLERNLPPAPVAPPPALAAPSPPAGSADARPLGPSLRAIVLLGPGDAPASAAPAMAVDSSRLGGAARAALPHALAPFIGRPLSRKLISDIETAVVRVYRDRGHPFVEVSAPEQELTGGVLSLRVIEFRVGKIGVAGAPPREAARIAGALRAAPGTRIDSGQLEQDLEWLDRYPFRTLSLAVTPGADLGETDIDLVAIRSPPWRVFTGYQRSDSRATGEDRWFVGAVGAVPLLPDAWASYQLTGSDDFWADRAPFAQTHPHYISQAGRIVVPTAPRQAIEITVDAVETNEMAQAFVIRQSTFEATVDYRFALSNLVSLPGDLALGVEAKRQIHDTFFGPTDVVAGSIDVLQALVDWTASGSDSHGQTSADIALHLSPGGVDARNTGAAFATFTNGRLTGAEYAYASFDLNRVTRLPRGFSLIDELTGQLAGSALPPSEQAAIGGPALVRGYLLDDGAFDDTVVGRQEVHAPALVPPWRGLSGVLTPFVFGDLGYAHDQALAKSYFAASAGVGLSLQAVRHVSADLSAAVPLTTIGRTHSGDVLIDSRLTIAF